MNEEEAKLLPVEDEPDACDVLVNSGQITWIFHVTRLFLQGRKLDSQTAIDWTPTDFDTDRRSLGLPLGQFSPVNLDWRSNSSMETFRRQAQQYFDPSKKLDFPWTQIVMSAALKVNEFITTPSDFETAEHVDIVEAKYLVRPILPARGVTIWFGQGEAGKGYLAVGAATCLMLQRAFAGLRTAEVGHIYYIDYEEVDKEEFDIRVTRVANGLGLYAAPIQHFNPRGRLFVDLQDALKAKIIKDGGKPDNALLIVDSALPAVGGEAIDPQPVGNFFNAINYIGLPTLLIAHDTKVGNEDSPYGSIFWRNLSRLCVNFQAADEPHRDLSGNYVRDILLRCVKANNLRRFSPLAFQLVFSDDEATAAPSARATPATWIRQTDATTVSAELQAKLPLRQRLVAFLRERKDAPPTTKQIVEATGLTHATVYNTLARYPSLFLMEGGGRGRGNEATWRVKEEPTG